MWLQAFNEGARHRLGGVMAGSTVMALPVVIFFLIVQRKATAGLTAGAVKDSVASPSSASTSAAPPHRRALQR